VASRNPQTQQKRARELAVKERRERKEEKRRARAIERRARTNAAESGPTGPESEIS
jgi:hypothetical protein